MKNLKRLTRSFSDRPAAARKEFKRFGRELLHSTVSLVLWWLFWQALAFAIAANVPITLSATVVLRAVTYLVCAYRFMHVFADVLDSTPDP